MLCDSHLPAEAVTVPSGEMWKLTEQRPCRVDEAFSFLPAAEHKQELLCVTLQKSKSPTAWETLQGM